jgi:hypothetical protein
MKTIERKRYHQPVIRVIKINPIRLMAGTGDHGSEAGGGSTNTSGNGYSRGFFFEDDD